MSHPYLWWIKDSLQIKTLFFTIPRTILNFVPNSQEFLLEIHSIFVYIKDIYAPKRPLFGKPLMNFVIENFVDSAWKLPSTGTIMRSQCQ